MGQIINKKGYAKFIKEFIPQDIVRINCDMVFLKSCFFSYQE